MHKRFYEIFRAGNYPQGSFSAEDIAEIAANYNPSWLEAPVTIDHPWGGPAYGWIDELKAEGDRLLASFKEVSDTLKIFSATKQFKRHSVEIYNNLELAAGENGRYLKALSLLGADAPQVKGMEPIDFASFSEKFPVEESQVVEIDEPVRRVINTFSEWLQAQIDEKDLSPAEFAQAIGHDEDIIANALAGQELEDMASFASACADHFKVDRSDIEEFIPSPGKEDGGDEPPESVPYSEFAQVTEQLSQLQARLEELSGKADDAEAFQAEVNTLKFEQRKADFTQFLDAETKAGKLPPKVKTLAVDLFASLDNAVKEEGADKTPLKIFTELIEGLPTYNFAELPDPDTPVNMADPHALAAEITAYQDEQRKQGRVVSASQALTHIKKTRTNR